MDMTTNLVIQVVLCIILFALTFSLMRSNSMVEEKINKLSRDGK